MRAFDGTDWFVISWMEGTPVPVTNDHVQATLGERAPVSAPDGPSFIAVPEVRGGVELVAQPHGGALRRVRGRAHRCATH